MEIKKKYPFKKNNKSTLFRESADAGKPPPTTQDARNSVLILSLPLLSRDPDTPTKLKMGKCHCESTEFRRMSSKNL